MSNQYDVILADPPWKNERQFGRNTGSRAVDENHYSSMSTDEICALNVPVADNCALFLWATFPCLPQAFTVINAWGFEYRTIAWVWVKLTESSMGFHFGMGNYTRANSEPCLLAVRGSMPVQAHDVQALIVSPVMQHSRKPNEQYSKIERLYPDMRYLEMFARRRRQGWDAFGNEVEGSVSLQPSNTACSGR